MADPAGVSAGPAAFFEQVCDSFRRAAAATGGAVEHWYDLMGRSTVVVGAGDALLGPLTAALAHRRCESAPGPPALRLLVWDERSTGVGLPGAPWGPTAYGAKGVIDGFNDERFSTVFAPGVDLFHMFDRETGIGAFWLEDAAALPYWERGFPLRTLLHWSTGGTGRQLVHSGGVGIGDGAVLLTGVGGSGKSTTTLTCLEAGMDYAGDDYVAFELASRPGDAPRLHSLYSSAKVDHGTLERFPALRPLTANAGSDDEKALLLLHPAFGRRLASGQRIRAVVLPQVTGRPDTRVVEASPVAAVRALAPTTVFQLPRLDREAFARVVALSRAVPSYHLELGTDRDQIAPAVARLLAG
jgi:hypothetical protein